MYARPLILAATLVVLVGGLVPLTQAAQDRVRPETLSLAPARTVYTVRPGQTYNTRVVFRNLTRSPFTAHVVTRDLKPADDDGTFAVIAQGQARGAGKWFAPAVQSRRVQPDEKLDIPVRITVPADVRPGVYPAAVLVQRVLSNPASNERDGARITVTAGAASQFILTVPGGLETKAHLEQLDSPRVLWPGDKARFAATLVNDGDTFVTAKGHVAIGPFTGYAQQNLQLPDKVDLLPGAQRRLEVEWDDRPPFGWFEPSVVLDVSTRPVNRSYPLVFVLPPWWMVALLVAALMLPIVFWLRRRSRRDDEGLERD